MDGRMAKQGHDLEGLADALAALRDRIARLEGDIEGAAMVVARQRRIEE